MQPKEGQFDSSVTRP
nr:unnamed protein product [Callosobruchus chinensis]